MYKKYNTNRKSWIYLSNNSSSVQSVFVGVIVLILADRFTKIGDMSILQACNPSKAQYISALWISCLMARSD